MSSAPQQDLFSSTQPHPVVSSVLTSVSSLPVILVFSSGPSASTFDQPLVSPAICSTVGLADLPNVSSTATTEVPYFWVKLCFHDVSRSANPRRHCRPNHVLLAPMLWAVRTVTPRKQWLPCLVHTLLVCISLFHCCLCVLFAFVCCNVHFRSTPSYAMQSHIILHVFSSNLSQHPCFFLQLPSLAASRNHLVLFCYFSNSPFTSAFQLCFLFNHATLGLRPCPRFCLHSGHNHFFIVPFRSQLLAILVARYCPALIVAIFGNFLWWFSTKRL